MSDEKTGLNLELHFTDQYGNSLFRLKAAGVTLDNLDELFSAVHTVAMALLECGVDLGCAAVGDKDLGSN